LGAVEVHAPLTCTRRADEAARVVETHAMGRAIDVRALRLKNGVTIDVAKGWRDPVAGQVLRKAHAAACKDFRTVLGPAAKPAYRDRFHLDTGSGRGRRICG
jgi:hypothetical protein